MKIFDRGERVSTPKGEGRVVYCRFLAPKFSEPQSYSVVLDSMIGNLTYSGTIFSAGEVTEPQKKEKTDIDGLA
jgi:hypothetical protein